MCRAGLACHDLELWGEELVMRMCHSPTSAELKGRI